MRVGFVGLGAMGTHMARNLHRAGLLSAVWNRTGEKARALASELSVQAPSTLAALASSIDALVSCVSADDDVLAVVRSEEHTYELQSLAYLVCRLLLEKKKIIVIYAQPVRQVDRLDQLHQRRSVDELDRLDQ